MIEIGNYIVDLELISIVATPIISLIAIIIYARALQNSRRQNEVLLSQNIKPNFIKEIRGILDDGKNTGHIITISKITGEKKSFDHIHIFDGLDYHIRRLINSEEFNNDRKQKINLTEESLGKKSYWNDLYWIRQIINKYSSSTLFYKSIVEFLDNLDDSRMIDEDKYSVKNEIKRQILKIPLKTYHLNFLNLGINKYEIPIFTLENHRIEWKKLEDSSLFKSMKKIEDFTSK